LFLTREVSRPLLPEVVGWNLIEAVATSDEAASSSGSAGWRIEGNAAIAREARFLSTDDRPLEKTAESQEAGHADAEESQRSWFWHTAGGN